MIWLLALTTILISEWGFRNQKLRDQFTLHGRDWRTILTYGFVHTSWPHLIYNMIGLLVFGADTQQASAIYIAGLLLPGAAMWWLGRSCIGASGGTFALMFAWVAQYPSPIATLGAVVAIGALGYGRHPVHFLGALTGVTVTVIVGAT